MNNEPSIRVIEMSMNDAWFRDIGPTVSFFTFFCFQNFLQTCFFLQQLQQL
jgi:hypothetical protein